MKSAKTSCKMHGESWRHQRQLQCHAKKRSPKLAFGKPVFRKHENPKHLKKRQDSVVLLKHMNRQDTMVSVTKRIHEEHIAGKGQNSVLHCNLVHQFLPMPQAMKVRYAKVAVVKKWKMLETIPAWDVRELKSRNNNKVHFAAHVIYRIRRWSHNFRSTKEGLCFEGIL